MSTEIKASVLGVSGKYKREVRSPAIIKPCEHYIRETNNKDSVMRIHGKQDGSSTVERISLT